MARRPVKEAKETKPEARPETRPRSATKSKLASRERERRSLQLRMAGMTYDDIAQNLGYANRASARAAVLRALQRHTQEPAEELVRLDTERLNAMLLMLWPKVQDPDSEWHFSAIREARAIMADIRSLHGAATRRDESGMNVNINIGGDDVLVIAGDKEAYLDGLKKMAAATGEPLPALMAGDTSLSEVVSDDMGDQADQDNDNDDEIVEAEIVEGGES